MPHQSFMEFIQVFVIPNLLRQHAAAETGDFLFTLPKVGDLEAAARTAIAGIVPGTVIGPYVVEEEIGRGGMGAVWRARRSDGAIKRPLALKLPHAGPHSQQLIERFNREREAYCSATMAKVHASLREDTVPPRLGK